MSTIQFINTSPNALVNLIDNAIEKRFQELQKTFQPKDPPKYVTRNYVADEMLHCDISTVHNLTVRGVLTKYQCGARVLYVRQEVEEAIVKLKK
jgi:hypothetical protein